MNKIRKTSEVDIPKETIKNGIRHVLCREDMKYYPELTKENGITYKLDEQTFLYHPQLESQDTNQDIGKYGRLRLEYLKNHKKGFLTQLMIQDRLNRYLVELNQAAHEQVNQMMEKMLKKDPLPEGFLEQVQHRNALMASAEEIVLREMIYK